MNPYLRDIEAVLPRVLGAFDTNAISPTRGLGDRLHWAWKGADFANATMQGSVNGLARLVSAGLVPFGLPHAAILNRIGDAISATAALAKGGKGLSEAFPSEQSFCVAALVAFDTLAAAEHVAALTPTKQREGWIEAVAPLVGFIMSNDETHAIISNHLATGAAALFRWADVTGDQRTEQRAQALLDRILAHQSKEGWFSEYGGADPGYESLGINYLADLYGRRPSTALRAALQRSLGFLRHFAHPDGSFGGIYGSRNTRFIYPGGLLRLAPDFPEAAALARFAEGGVAARTLVTLATLDDGNLAPMFNSYCWAATLNAPASGGSLGYEEAAGLQNFPEAGLLVDSAPTHHTIVSTAKGGIVAHYPRESARPAMIDPGVAVRRGRVIATTQRPTGQNKVEITGRTISVTAPLTEAVTERQTPLKFLILRVLALTLFWHRPTLEFIKRMLVRRLITKPRAIGVTNTRCIVLGDPPNITDHLSDDGPVRLEGAFTAIHMASAGYWQMSDDRG